MLKTGWQIWQHGALLAVIYGFGLFFGFMVLALPAYLINAIFQAFGSGLDANSLMRLLFQLCFVWAPFGIGYMARFTSSEDLKPEGYSKPESRLAKLARKARR